MEANGDKNDYFCALFSRKGHANIMTQTLENNNRSNLNKSGVHTHSGCEVRRERDYYTVSLCNGSFFTNTRKKKVVVAYCSNFRFLIFVYISNLMGKLCWLFIKCNTHIAFCSRVYKSYICTLYWRALSNFRYSSVIFVWFVYLVDKKKKSGCQVWYLNEPISQLLLSQTQKSQDHVIKYQE